MARTLTVSSTEVLAGLVDRVTFHNSDNGFCVLRVKARGQRDLITLVGHAAMISAGEFVQAMKAAGLGTGLGNRGNPPYERIRHYFFDMGNDFPIGAVDSTMASHRMQHNVITRTAIVTTIAVAVRPISDNSRTPPYARFDPTRTFGRPYVADCLPKRTSRFRANQNRQLS